MHGNTPYAGLPGTVPFGAAESAGLEELDPDDRRRIERELSQVVARVQTYLPDDYVVDSELAVGSNGLQATVAVKPPVGDVVSAGLVPTLDDIETGETLIDRADREEVARGLAASAAWQVKNSVDDLTPTAL